MKSLFANWKTSYIGITMIVGALVHLVFHVRDGTADESTWKNDILGICGGLGLIFAGDASVSAKETQAVTDAVVTGDTRMLKKSDVKPEDK